MLFLKAPVVPTLAKPSAPQPEPVAAVGPVSKSPPNELAQHPGTKVSKVSIKSGTKVPQEVNEDSVQPEASPLELVGVTVT